MDKRNYFFNKWVGYGAILVITYVINTTFLDWIRIFHIKPNLLVALLVCFAVFENYLTGGIFGLFAGLFCDVLSSKAVGPGIISLMACGFAVGYFCNTVLQKSLINSIWLTFCASFVYNAIFYLAFYASFNFYEIFIAFCQIIIPEAAYSAAFAFPFYFLARKLHTVLKETQ